MPVPSSVAIRTVCVPIGVSCTNDSPDFVVFNVLLSKNQNIRALGVGDTAINEIGVLLRFVVMTVLVSGAGDTITGAVFLCAMLSKSQPGTYGGGVLRSMPARRNRSRNSASQNSKTAVCVVSGLFVHAR